MPLAVAPGARVLDIRPGVEPEDEATVWEELDFVAELLADGRPYLCGERFGAADLTFAALSAAIVVPPIYGVPLPQPELAARGDRSARAAGPRAPRRTLRARADRRAPPRAGRRGARRLTRAARSGSAPGIAQAPGG